MKQNRVDAIGYVMVKYLLVVFIFISSSFSGDLEEFQTIKESYLKSNNVWLGIYRNQKVSIKLKSDIALLEQKKRNSKMKVVIDREIFILQERLKVNENISKKFNEVLSLPINQLDDIKITLFSLLFNNYNKKLDKYENEHKKAQEEYKSAIVYFDSILEKLLALDEKGLDQEKFQDFLKEVKLDREYFKISSDFLNEQSTLLNTYKNIIKRKVNNYIEGEIPQIALAVLFLILLIVIFIYSRKLINKKITDEDKQFAYKNSINLILLISMSIFTLFFFMDNIVHIATILGFFGAAFIIASKEVLLGFPAFIYLTITRNIKVGDRIRYVDQNEVHIGDVISITPLAIGLYETINHTTAFDHKRAGRILFFPPHYVFFKSFYNYTHENMKTIFDLIEIDLDTENDFDEAERIALEIIGENSSKYIDLAAKQYESLKRKYEMRNFNPKTQIQFLFSNEHGCMTMMIWYVAPYRDVLNFRSYLTREIFKVFKEKKITIVKKEQ